MKKLLAIVFLHHWIFCCFSQEIDTLKTHVNKFPFDTSRITDLSDKLAFYFNISGKMHSVDIASSNSNAELQLQPNGKTTIGFGLDYKWIGIGTSFSLPFMNKDDEKYGETDKFDMQINYYRNNLGADAYIRYYKGFYLANPGDFMDWQAQNFPLCKNVETYALGFSAYYIFNNKNFSYKAVFPRTMWQKKSAGSMIGGIYFSLNSCVAPGGVLPEELPDSLVNYFNIDGFSGAIAGIAFGYTYTWVIKKRFFANLSVVPGVGYAHTEITIGDGSIKTKDGAAASVTSRISLGFEGKKLYYGFNLVSIIDNFTYENVDVSATTGNLRFYVGKRFDISKFIKKQKTLSKYL